MKMLFISPNRETGFRPVFPIGANIVAGAVSDMGWTTRLCDLCFSKSPLEDVKNEILEFEPDFVGVSIRNIDFQSYLEPVFHLPFIKRVIDTIKKYNPKSVIILGGCGYSLAPKEILRYMDVRYGIYGPGENAMPMLLKCLTSGGNLEDCDGLVWVNDKNEIQINNIQGMEEDFFHFTKEQRRKHYDKRYYAKEWSTKASPVTDIADAVEGKRGCPKQCIYCTNSYIARNRIMLKPPAVIADEIEDIIKIGCAKRFEFTEGAFNLPISHAKKVINELKERKIRFPWNCMFSPAGYEYSLVQGMAETGCDLVEMGIESGSDTILTNLKKGFRFQKVIDAQKGLLESGIRIEHCIFIGSPGETEETVKESLERVEKLLESDNVHLFINFGYRIFPNTELANIALNKEIIKKDSNLAFPHYYIEPAVLHNENLLDYIENWVVEHKKSYLWWGLPHIHLKERVAEVSDKHRQMLNIFSG